MSNSKQITKVVANEENGQIKVVWTQFDGDGEVPGYARPGRLGLAEIKFSAAIDSFYSQMLKRLQVHGIWDEQYRNLSINLKLNFVLAECCAR